MLYAIKNRCWIYHSQWFRSYKSSNYLAPPAAYQDGMIGPHWSKGWIIEDCEISNSKCAGISLGKYYDPENDHYLLINMLRVQLKWKETRYAVDSIMAGLRKK